MKCHASDLGYSVIKDPWRTFVRSYFVQRAHCDVDAFDHDRRALLNFVKSEIYGTTYLKVLGFVDFVIRSPQCPRDYYLGVEAVLNHTHAAYRIVDRLIVPISSEENAAAISAALAAAAAHPAKGPNTHLRSAANELTGGDWAGAIRESIHAVEAVAKVIEPSADMLGPALAKLETRGLMNGAQKKAFSALYGYTSDTEGVRHALTLEAKAAVTEQDAMFMFGACVAFVGYFLSAEG
jgi:hypothetical protein